jgi:cell division protein FtsI (penicillin-binding protein 3)
LAVGEKTGIELMGESRGIFNAKEKPSPIRLSNMSFGHGVALTGIQMLKAYSAIANDGKIVSPTIVKKNKKSKKYKSNFEKNC